MDAKDDNTTLGTPVAVPAEFTVEIPITINVTLNAEELFMLVAGLDLMSHDLKMFPYAIQRARAILYDVLAKRMDGEFGRLQQIIAFYDSVRAVVRDHDEDDILANAVWRETDNPS